MERNGNIKRHDTMEKGTFQRFIVEDIWVSKRADETDTILFTNIILAHQVQEKEIINAVFDKPSGK